MGTTQKALALFWSTLVAGLPSAGLADNRAVAVVVDSDDVVAEARVALVIGNGKYTEAPLPNPPHDAVDIAAALRKLRFDVELHTDVDQQRMEDAIRAFGRRLNRGGVGLFYYAGHGMQVDGRNFLIPVGAVIHEEKDIKYKAVDLGQVLDEFESAKNRVNILILDACRDNPFRGVRGGGTRGLAKTDAPRGTIVAYATAPGSVAADGGGRNGIYTQELLGVLAQPGLAIEQVFKEVRRRVVAASTGRQTPWESSSLTGDFEFIARPAVSATVERPLPPPRVSPSAADDVLRENKRRWDAWFAEMREAEGRVVAFERAPNPPDLKAQMWQRFASAFAADDPYTDEDAKLRAKAAERTTHWQAQQPEAARRMTVDDLEDQARARQASRLTDMQESFEAASAYENKLAPPDLKAEAWRRFLTTFAADLPDERADDELRSRGDARLAHWKAQKDEQPGKLALDDLGDAKSAARGVLARYRSAYETRDLNALSQVWVMNPQQRASMRQLFECADRVTLELSERSLEHDGDMVAIDFDQRVGFSGSRCMMSASSKPAAMTAVIMRTGSGWMISSILPRRTLE